MRYPEFLKEHGTVGFVAPSFGCTTEPYTSAFAKARQRIEEAGYRTAAAPACFAEDGIGISSSPERCGRELTEWYCSADNDILISAGGGELMCEILDYVDFDRISEAPAKWFMGYSDNTNFTFPLATLCDTAAIYGPNAPGFGQSVLHPAMTDAWEVLTGKRTRVESFDLFELPEEKDPDEEPTVDWKLNTPVKLVPFPEGAFAARGRLLGGCLDILGGCLLGTSWDRTEAFAAKYKDDGILWYLEACDLNVFDVRRTLWHMLHAGWFRNASGFIFGRPMHFGESAMGLDHYRAVTDVLGGLGVPILMDADIGHLPPRMPIVNGALADARLVGGRLVIDMQMV